MLKLYNLFQISVTYFLQVQSILSWVSITFGEKNRKQTWYTRSDLWLSFLCSQALRACENSMPTLRVVTMFFKKLVLFD